MLSKKSDLRRTISTVKDKKSMLIDGDPNLTELLFYSIKIQLSIEDLSKEIKEIHRSIYQERFALDLESGIISGNRGSED